MKPASFRRQLDRLVAGGLVFRQSRALGVMYEAGWEFLGAIYSCVQERINARPELAKFFINLTEVDILLIREPPPGRVDGDYILAISRTRRAQVPLHHYDTRVIGKMRRAGLPHADKDELATDLSDGFGELFALNDMAGGLVFGGHLGGDTDAAKLNRIWRVADAIAKGLEVDAVSQRDETMKARIFLSHKGANKPVVRSMDKTLRALGLPTWLDEDALPAGKSLIRALDQGVRSCSAAVFFIADGFHDEEYIRIEVEAALDERRMRGDAFSIIPLVLLDHGGSENLIPDPFRVLTWKSVRDVDILREIVLALPVSLKRLLGNAPV